MDRLTGPAISTAAQLADRHPAWAISHLRLFDAASGVATNRIVRARAKDRNVAGAGRPSDQRFLSWRTRTRASYEALEQMSRSVMLAPQIESHFYPRNGGIQRLTAEQHRAVEQGYKLAAAHVRWSRGRSGLILRQARQVFGRAAFLSSAAVDGDHAAADGRLIAAAEAFAKAGEGVKARSSFEKAVNLRRWIHGHAWIFCLLCMDRRTT
jgi:hypothetical protein